MPKKPLFALLFLACLLLLSVWVIRFKSRQLREMRLDQERVAALGESLQAYLKGASRRSEAVPIDTGRYEATQQMEAIYTDTVAAFFRTTGVHFLGYPKLSEILFHAYTGQRFKDELEFRLFLRCHAEERGIDSLAYAGSAEDFSVWLFRGASISHRRYARDTLRVTDWQPRETRN